MGLIAWTDDLSVGVAPLDAHHKTLINLLNELSLAIETGHEADVIGPVLGELVRYVFYHFGEEERLMQAAGFVDLPAHRQSHRAIAERVRAMESLYDAAPDQVIAEELRDFLSDWLLHHIRTEDRRYRPTLERAGLALGT